MVTGEDRARGHMRTTWIALLVTLATICLAVDRTAAQTPASGDGWVVIPVTDYRMLRGKAYPIAPTPPPPPIDATLTRLAYDLTLAGESVTGTATADVDVLKEGWVSVLIPAGLLVRDARIDGRPVSLIDSTPSSFEARTIAAHVADRPARYADRLR